MHRSLRSTTFISLAIVLLTLNAHSYEVLVSLNTYEKSNIDHALPRVSELTCDGVWLITQNADFIDREWKGALDTLGGIQITEDNPNKNKSYVDYTRIMGKEPDGSFCYNETGGKPGGTLLSDDQIDTQYASHGSKPIIVLTRSYGGQWRTETDRCLPNPKVDGLCMEYVKKALLENINAPAGAIKAALKQKKPVFLLLHAGDGWTLEENKRIIENLYEWCPEEMRSDDVHLVYQCYHGNTEAWFGKGGMKEAIQQAKTMLGYSGPKQSKDNSSQGDNKAEPSPASDRPRAPREE